MSNLGGGAEAHARFKQYEYRANSSLVLTTDSCPRDTHELTGELESLYGKIDPKSFGDRAARGRPPELDEKLKKSSKRKKERELLSEQAPSANGDGLDNEVGVAVGFEENDDDDDDDSDLGLVQDEEEKDEDLAEACSSEVMQMGGNLLEVTHEGTSEVKRSKIDLLMSKYERFVMEPRENIQEMFTRFTNITNELISLGRLIPTNEQVRKILRSLP